MRQLLTFVKYILYMIGFGLLIPITFTFFTVGGLFLLVFGILGAIANAPIILAESINNEHWVTDKIKEVVKEKAEEIKKETSKG